MHKPCLFLLLFCCLAATAQKRIDIDAGCAFNTDAKNTRPYVFDADPQAQQIVGDVCRAIGITQRFQLQSADVKNALACERNGTRYILYNPDFLKDIQTDARTKWAAYGVLAHEIGHHVNGDHFDEPDSERRKELELEADRFAGSALRLMGATKDEAKSAVASLFNQEESNTHPPARARNASVVNGWNDQDTRLRNMGVTGVNDPGNTSATRTVVRDRDGDGIPDGQDACPDVPGETILNGCPDADGDGITDDADECPYKKGEGRWKGCPDSDADGIPDNKDKCPYVYGELQDNGCPPPDDDLDGIPNSADRCPQLAGTARYRGCPDTDGDGVPDPDDKCPNEKGDPIYEGCSLPSTLVASKEQQEAQKEAESLQREQAERDKKKKQIGASFGKPKEDISGRPGNTTFGSGGGGSTGILIENGLSSRAVRSRGTIKDSPQKEGKVAIEVCVDSDGNVISAQYKMKGSTTSDAELHNKALASARAYKFAPSSSAKECGTITFNFQLK